MWDQRRVHSGGRKGKKNRLRPAFHRGKKGKTHHTEEKSRKRGGNLFIPQIPKEEENA